MAGGLRDYRRGDDSSWPTAKQSPGSVYIYEGLLINLLLSMFHEVEYANFKVIVALTGHYPHWILGFSSPSQNIRMARRRKTAGELPGQVIQI